jgi:hypothetical protein
VYFDDWDSIPGQYGDQEDLTLCIIKDKVCISGITFAKGDDDSSYEIMTSTLSEWQRKGLNTLATSLAIIACDDLNIKTITSYPSNYLTPYTQNRYFKIQCLKSDGLTWVQREAKTGRILRGSQAIKDKIEDSGTLTPAEWKGTGITDLVSSVTYVC